MLKYLFTAVYSDGTSYTQNVEDRSISAPGERSCFYDIDQDRLVKFILAPSPEDECGDGHVYSVDLVDGHFEVDGVPFKMHEEANLLGFRLIFWRNHTHDFLVGKDPDAEPEEVNHRIVYRLGWQCTVDDVNHQRVMEIT